MTSGPEKRDHDDALAAEYVAGVLPHAERSAFAARLEQEKSLQEKVRFWSEQLSPLADAVEPVAPPPAVLGAVEERLFASQTAKAGWWSNLHLWRGLAIASLAALIVIGLFLSAAPERQPSLVAEISGEAGAVRLVALFDQQNSTLRLNRTDGQPASNRSFELWLIEGDQNPVSLGVLPADTKSNVVIPGNLRNRMVGAVLAISDEPRGGSPTGQPTGPVLATGTIVEI